MKNIRCSIVVPSRNRIARFHQYLQSYNQQTSDQFEVIVVDDGSDDPAREDMHKWTDEFNFPLKVILSEHRGPAHARNLGARHASGEIILFCGDDCIADKHLVEVHIDSYSQNSSNTCSQGLTLWHPDVDSPFQDFLYTEKYQADYEQLKKPDGSWQKFAPLFCMTTNYSIRRDVFLEYSGFNEEFTNACWEDFELAIRLGATPPVFLPNALNYHHHKYDLQSYAQRQFMEGTWRPLLCKLHPTAAPKLLPAKQLHMTLGKDWKSLITSNDTDIGEGVALEDRKKYWKEVLDTATYCGANSTCREWGKGWQFLPYISSDINTTSLVKIFNQIENAPEQLISQDLSVLDSGFPEWLVFVLKGEAYKCLENKEEASRFFELAIQDKYEVQSLCVV